MCRYGSRGPLLRLRRCAERPGTTASSRSTSSGPDEFAEAVARVADLRSAAGADAARPYDVVATLPDDADPAPYADLGATWWLPELDPGRLSVPEIRALIRRGPWKSGLTTT